MRTQRLYSRLAIEGIEADAVAPGEEVVADAVPEGTDGLEAELIEVAHDIVDLADGEATTDEATDVAEELEVAAESLRIIASEGGLDRNGAKILALYQGSLNRQLGLPATHRAMSVESFGATHSRIGMTTLAAESFADKARELWTKIVEMFRNALKAVVAVWNRIFDGAERMKARAEKLVAISTKLKEGDTKPFEAQKLAENLHIGGVVNAMTAADAVLREAGELPKMSGAAKGFAEGVMKAVTEDASADAIGQAAAAMGGNLSTHFAKVADAASVGMEAPGEGLELRKSGALPGNKAIIAIVALAGAKAEAVGKVGYKLGTFDAAKKVADKAQLATLSPADIGALGKKISEAAGQVLAYKAAQKEAEAIAGKVIAMAEAKAKETAKEGAAAGADAGMVDKAKGAVDGIKAGRMAGKDARALTKGAMSAVINGMPPIAAFVLNAGGYCIQYGEQSAKQYGKAGKTEEKAPAAAPAAAKA